MKDTITDLSMTNTKDDALVPILQAILWAVALSP